MTKRTRIIRVSWDFDSFVAETQRSLQMQFGKDFSKGESCDFILEHLKRLKGRKQTSY